MREKCWKCQGPPRGFMPCSQYACLSRTARALGNQAAAALIRARDPEERAGLAETIANAQRIEARHREAAEEGRE